MAGTITFELQFPTQAQIQAMAGVGVTISTVAFPEVPQIQITSDDETEAWDARIAEGMAPYGWQPVSIT
jgi:hypothetical protein